MQLISKYDKGFWFLLSAINTFSKYAWVVPLNDKKITMTYAFQKFLDESNNKPEKISLDKVSQFYSRPMKSSLQDNDIKMYSTHNEEKPVIAERFIKTLINNIATNAALNAVKNKIPNVSNLIKKTNFDAKPSDIESKYFTASDLNMLTNEMLNGKIKKKDLVTKSDISGFIDKSDLDKKIEH